jgi:hypothetical protein
MCSEDLRVTFDVVNHLDIPQCLSTIKLTIQVSSTSVPAMHTSNRRVVAERHTACRPAKGSFEAAAALWMLTVSI